MVRKFFEAAKRKDAETLADDWIKALNEPALAGGRRRGRCIFGGGSR
jgi:hypothetical protein